MVFHARPGGPQRQNGGEDLAVLERSRDAGVDLRRLERGALAEHGLDEPRAETGPIEPPRLLRFVAGEGAAADEHDPRPGLPGEFERCSGRHSCGTTGDDDDGVGIDRERPEVRCAERRRHRLRRPAALFVVPDFRGIACGSEFAHDDGGVSIDGEGGGDVDAPCGRVRELPRRRP
jgi:hypothetical protein